MNKLSQQEYKDLIDQYEQWKLTRDTQRDGQVLMNILWAVNNDVWANVNITKKYNPFYDDDKIPTFMELISPENKVQ